MSNYYVPILKWKRGEQVALQHLTPEIKEKIMPVIEIVPIPYDYENDQPAKTINEHLVNVCEQIVTCWGHKPIFIDLNLIDDITEMANGDHPVTYLLSEANRMNLSLIPVTSNNRSIEYNNAINEALANNLINQICIRLEDDSFLDPESAINNITEITNISKSNCHLMVDFKFVSQNDKNSKILMAPTIINGIQNINDYKSFSLCLTSFPETLSDVAANSTGLIHRTDFEIWHSVMRRSDILNRNPQFGDYAIANPYMQEVDPRFMDMSGNIRYTISTEYFIAKGISTKRNGFSQMKGLCRTIIAHPEFSGSAFSWGDKYIADCANNVVSNGNAETWRRVGTNHHITFLVDQLSTLSYF